MHFMNPQRGKHMEGGEHEEHGGHAKHPHFAIHSHAHGHVVHITHPDGHHEHHEHALGDAEGIAAHIHQHIGSGGGEQRPEAEEQGEGLQDATY